MDVFRRSSSQSLALNFLVEANDFDVRGSARHGRIVDAYSCTVTSGDADDFVDHLSAYGTPRHCTANAVQAERNADDHEDRSVKQQQLKPVVFGGNPK